MDSMRNLRGSLPRTNSRSRPAPPPEDLLQTFKSAALSVTNLYKRAVEDLVTERKAGYQDALYDLLSLMDKENIGVGDGEGWRIRQWATERLNLGPERDPGSEGEDDSEPRETTVPRDDEHETVADSSPPRETEPVSSLPPPVESSRPTSTEPITRPPRLETFAFQAPHAYPEVDMDAIERQSSMAQQTRAGSISRTTRRAHASHQRQARQSRPLGNGAGVKRRIHVDDFFGLGSLGDGPGPKRPRPM